MLQYRQIRQGIAWQPPVGAMPRLGPASASQRQAAATLPPLEAASHHDGDDRDQAIAASDQTSKSSSQSVMRMRLCPVDTSTVVFSGERTAARR
jgi:hypothetical protein